MHKLSKILDVIGVVLLCAVLYLGVRLYQGPVRVPFLKPYILKALNNEASNFQISLDKVQIELAKGLKPIDLKAIDISVSRKDDDDVIANIPELSLEFSFKAILDGDIAPKSVNIYRPVINLYHKKGNDWGIGGEPDEDNETQIVDEAEKKADLNKDLSELSNVVMGAEVGALTTNEVFEPAQEKTLDENNKTQAVIDDDTVELSEIAEVIKNKNKLDGLKYLSEVKVIDANLTINDYVNDRVINIPDFDIGFKDEGEYIKAHTFFNIDTDNKPAELEIDAEYWHENSLIKGQIGVAGFRPYDYANMSDSVEFLKKVDAPIDIAVDFGFDLGAFVNGQEQAKMQNKMLPFTLKNVTKFDFTVSGGVGTIYPPEDVPNHYSVYGFKINGGYSSVNNSISLKKINVDVGDAKVDALINVSGLGPLLDSGDIKDLNIDISTRARGLVLDNLYKYWPENIGHVAWQWCKDNLTVGTVTDSNFNFVFAADEDGKHVINKVLKGSVTVKGATVNYIDTMPKVTNVDGVAKFSKTAIDIDVAKGIIEGATIHKGRVLLYNLGMYESRALIEASADAELKNVLKIIDAEPLGFAKAFGLNNVSEVKGQGNVNLSLNFALDRLTTADKIAVGVDAKIKDAFIPKIFKGDDFSNGDLTLAIKDKKMILSGTGVIKNIPLELEINENFANSRSKYRVKASLDEDARKLLGLNFLPFSDAYMNDICVADVVATETTEGQGNVGIRFDFTNSIIDLPMIGWQKKKGEVASATVSANYANGKITNISGIRVTGNNVSILGNVAMDSNGLPSLITLSEVKADRTDAEAVVGFVNGAIDNIDVKGKDYDLYKLLNTEEFEAYKKETIVKLVDPSQKNEAKDAEPINANQEKFKVDLQVDNLWLSKSGKVTNVTASLGKNGDKIDFLKMEGVAGNGNITIKLTPQENKTKRLYISSPDAGAALKSLGVYDNMVGGALEIKGYEDTSGVLKGDLTVSNYKIVNAPVLAKLLTVASFSGIVDLLGGEGISFDNLAAEFSSKNSVLNIDKGRTAGSAIGLTANGRIDLEKKQININGDIVPAYTINSFG